MAAVTVVAPVAVVAPLQSLPPLQSMPWSSLPVVVTNYGLVLW